MDRSAWKSLWKYLLIEIAVIAIALGLVRSEQMRNRLYEAKIYGETIASNIELSLNQYVSIVESLGDQYLEYGDAFEAHFPGICERIMRKDDTIGSLYIAPDGVIAMAYPQEVNAATIGFEPAKDPEQGEATRLAIESRETTVAGPHALVEGGTGFIVRYPIYVEDGGGERFAGLAILVMDWDRFVDKVTESYGERDRYHYAVWKDIREHILTDENGYIFKNGAVRERRVDIAVHAPNDAWHLTVEEAGGWGSFRQMAFWYLGAALLLLILTVFEWSVLRSRESRKKLEYAEAASAAKSAFLFNMSHDIRTPMNSVIGFTRLAMDHEDEPEKVHDYLSKILSSGNHLLTLINDILEMSRIESGKVQLNEEPCNLRDLMGDLTSMMEEQIREKGLNYEVRTEEIRYPVVCCDKLRVNQILLNLLSNAVKFTPEGGSVGVVVRQGVRAEGREESAVPCTFAIRDTGIGMAEEFAARIYDAFEREKTSTVSGIQGTGLGMAITKRLVDMMNGQIELKTQPGQGTEFTVTLPLRVLEEESGVAEATAAEETSEAEPPRTDGESLRGKHILLVEDILVNRMLAREVLTNFGMSVEEAEDGREALDRVSAAPAGTFDAILMDIQMPVMDGYEATRAIRALPDAQKAGIPIIAMTANAFEDDRQNALKAGMNGHIAKPLDFEKLLAELKKWLITES